MNNKTIHRIVRKVINEALGVNSYVEKAVDGIINKIIKLDASGQLEEKQLTNDIPILIKRGELEYNLIKDNVIKVEFRIYDFRNDEELQKFKENYPQIYTEKMYNASAGKPYKDSQILIRFSVVRAGGKIQNDSYDSLQHELDHALKMALTENGALSRRNYKNSMTRYVMEHGDSNKYVHVAAYMVYYSWPHEQDAFANGLYSYLKHSNPTKENLDELIYKSDYYSIINKMRTFLRALNELEGEEKEKINRLFYISFGSDVDKFSKEVANTLSKYIYKLGRIKTLILQQLSQQKN